VRFDGRRLAMSIGANSWDACELFGPARGLWVGRVTSRYGPVAAQLVPGTVGLSVDATLAINAHGIAALAWSFAKPYVAWERAVRGIAAATWRLGRAPSRPSVLSPITNGVRVGGLSVAINSHGTAHVLFANQQGISAAR